MITTTRLYSVIPVLFFVSNLLTHHVQAQIPLENNRPAHPPYPRCECLEEEESLRSCSIEDMICPQEILLSENEWKMLQSWSQGFVTRMKTSLEKLDHDLYEESDFKRIYQVLRKSLTDELKQTRPFSNFLLSHHVIKRGLLAGQIILSEDLDDSVNSHYKAVTLALIPAISIAKEIYQNNDQNRFPEQGSNEDELLVRAPDWGKFTLSQTDDLLVKADYFEDPEKERIFLEHALIWAIRGLASDPVYNYADFTDPLKETLDDSRAGKNQVDDLYFILADIHDDLDAIHSPEEPDEEPPSGFFPLIALDWDYPSMRNHPSDENPVGYGEAGSTFLSIGTGLGASNDRGLESIPLQARIRRIWDLSDPDSAWDTFLSKAKIDAQADLRRRDSQNYLQVAAEADLSVLKAIARADCSPWCFRSDAYFGFGYGYSYYTDNGTRVRMSVHTMIGQMSSTAYSHGNIFEDPQGLDSVKGHKLLASLHIDHKRHDFELDLFNFYGDNHEVDGLFTGERASIRQHGIRTNWSVPLGLIVPNDSIRIRSEALRRTRTYPWDTHSENVFEIQGAYELRW